eukprot:TRINITY_DN19814_c0_g1_i1.p1 TRINITY_DN19814_c0_g1~~TRINITY_DN19814_c0_g1_i1.p1  ORF type:complete len:262 (-),score=57.26 TRINITY_DN19814_c0_g1_i1:47-832(-)
MARLSFLSPEAQANLSFEEIEHNLEEVSLEADIRAIEIEAALGQLQNQLTLQEMHVKGWRKEMKKTKNNSPVAQAELENAQEEIQMLRRRCEVLETQRPPKPPVRPASAPEPGGGGRSPVRNMAAGSPQRAVVEDPAADLPLPGPVEMARRSAARASSARGESRGGGYSGASGSSPAVAQARAASKGQRPGSEGSSRCAVGVAGSRQGQPAAKKTARGGYNAPSAGGAIGPTAKPGSAPNGASKPPIARREEDKRLRGSKA